MSIYPEEFDICSLQNQMTLSTTLPRHDWFWSLQLISILEEGIVSVSLPA